MLTLASFFSDWVDSLKLRYRLVLLKDQNGTPELNKVSDNSFSSPEKVKKPANSKLKEFSCSFCSYKTCREGALTRHVCAHTGNMSNLAQHNKIQHTIEELRCSDCAFTTTSKDSRAILKQHMMTHSDEKKFSCEHCLYKSHRKGDLERHERNHTGEKPFKCTECVFSTPDQSILVRHQNLHKVKEFSCSYCLFKTQTFQQLTKHEKTHSKEKPFGCEKCKYTTIRKEDLARHKRRHSGEKPYKCSACSYSFTSKSGLNQHNKFNHPVKSFICSQCPFEANTEFTINNHEITHLESNQLAPLDIQIGLTKPQSTEEVSSPKTDVAKEEKQFKCSNCNFSTNDAAYLTRHKLYHVK